MKINIYLLLALLLGLSSCNNDCLKGDGQDIYTEQQIEDFQHIQLNLAAKLYLAPDTANKVSTIEISGQETTLDNISVSSDNGTLKINFIDCIDEHGDIRAIVHYNPDSLTQLTIENAASGLIESTKAITHSNLYVDNNGTGKVELSVIVDTINLSLSGSGNVILTGSAETMNGKVTSTGDINAFQMGSTYTILNLSGSGNVETTTSDSLAVNISGSGDVFYKGEPIIDANITGSGQIFNRN